MAETDPITVTRSELVSVFRKWETEKRLHPSTFSSPYDDAAEDVDSLAERSADVLLRYIGELPMTPGRIFRTLVESGRVVFPPLPPLPPLRFFFDAADRKPEDFLNAGDEPAAETAAREPDPVTVASCATKAAAALGNGDIDTAAGWTRLAEVLR